MVGLCQQGLIYEYSDIITFNMRYILIFDGTETIIPRRYYGRY